jgi:hypothetical protein
VVVLGPCDRNRADHAGCHNDFSIGERSFLQRFLEVVMGMRAR